MATLALACDAVPDLYLVDGSVEAASIDAAPGLDEGADDADDADDGGDAADGGQDGPVCTGANVICPGCAPYPGACCANDVPCFGDNCTADCAMCATCSGICCSKASGPPACHSKDAGKCPP
jgi:hypothetical protein